MNQKQSGENSPKKTKNKYYLRNCEGATGRKWEVVKRRYFWFDKTVDSYAVWVYGPTKALDLAKISLKNFKENEDFE